MLLNPPSAHDIAEHQMETYLCERQGQGKGKEERKPGMREREGRQQAEADVERWVQERPHERAREEEQATLEGKELLEEVLMGELTVS